MDDGHVSMHTYYRVKVVVYCILLDAVIVQVWKPFVNVVFSIDGTGRVQNLACWASKSWTCGCRWVIEAEDGGVGVVW